MCAHLVFEVNLCQSNNSVPSLTGSSKPTVLLKIEKKTQSGKNAGKAAVIREPRTTGSLGRTLGRYGSSHRDYPNQRGQRVQVGMYRHRPVPVGPHGSNQQDTICQITISGVPLEVRRRTLFPVYERMDSCADHAGDTPTGVHGPRLWRQ